MKKAILAVVLAALAVGAPAQRGDGDPAGAVYLLGAAGVRGLNNSDANNYFNSSQFGPSAHAVYAAHLGVQLERLLAVELSAEYGPVRSMEVSYQNGGVTTRRVKSDWTLTTFSVTPGLAWVGLNPWLGSASSSMLGVRFGLAKLDGRIQDDAFGSEGRYEQEAQAFDYGVIFRTEQIVVGRISIGLEGGYDWTRFPQVNNRNGSGSYNPVHSPERNVSTFGHGGDTTVLDFSGWQARVVLGFWSNAPVAQDLDDED